ncbi:hypothetical protein [Streptomyces shaanxiensis]
MAAKNNLFRDQELWQLRSSVLARVQRLKQEMQYRKASGEETARVAEDALMTLNEILDADIQGWSGVNRSVLQVMPGSEPRSP